MDDIYFSDKNKRRRKDEPSHSKRIVTDKFVESDIDNWIKEAGEERNEQHGQSCQHPDVGDGDGQDIAEQEG